MSDGQFAVLARRGVGGGRRPGRGEIPQRSGDRRYQPRRARAGGLRRPADAAGQDPVRFHRAARRRPLPLRPAARHSPPISSSASASTSCAPRSRSRTSPPKRRSWRVWGPEGVHHIDGVAAPDPRLAALGWRVIAAGRRAARAARLRAGERSRLRRPPHRARHPRGRHRLRLRRRLSARHRHGPACRRRFRQGLLHRPGGRLAHGASRHRPPALRHRAGDRRPARRRNRGDRRRQGARHARFVGRAKRRWRSSGSTGRRRRSMPARRSWQATRRSPCRFPAGRPFGWPADAAIRTDRAPGNRRNCGLDQRRT